MRKFPLKGHNLCKCDRWGAHTCIPPVVRGEDLICGGGGGLRTKKKIPVGKKKA
jgi:hypothetical protein